MITLATPPWPPWSPWFANGNFAFELGQSWVVTESINSLGKFTAMAYAIAAAEWERHARRMATISTNCTIGYVLHRFKVPFTVYDAVEQCRTNARAFLALYIKEVNREKAQ